MDKSVYQKLKELSWQRKLSPQEQAELVALVAAYPELETDWNDDAALTDCLNQLPDAPVSSNFTARVLQAIELEETRISRVQKRGWTAWRTGLRWVFRSAIAASVAAVAVFTSLQYRIAQQTEMARNVVHVSYAAATPKMEWLEDFDAIKQMSRVSSPADEELLAALQ